MGTRYGRKASDGTTEYYDSKEDLLRASQAESEEKLRAFLGFFGLLMGGFIAYMYLRPYADRLPQALRFLIVLSSSGASCYLLARFAVHIVTAIFLIIGLALLVAFVGFIWDVV